MHEAFEPPTCGDQTVPLPFERSLEQRLEHAVRKSVFALRPIPRVLVSFISF